MHTPSIDLLLIFTMQLILEQFLSIDFLYVLPKQGSLKKEKKKRKDYLKRLICSQLALFDACSVVPIQNSNL